MTHFENVHNFYVLHIKLFSKGLVVAKLRKCFNVFIVMKCVGEEDSPVNRTGNVNLDTKLVN